MIEAFKVGITIALMNRASGVLGLIAKDFSRTDAQAQRFKRSLKEIGMLTIGGGVLAGVGMAGLGVVHGWVNAATDYEQAYARFQALNLGNAVNHDADKFAQATALMGVSATDLMTTVTDLHTVFGRYDHARAMAPLIAQMEFANKAVYGDATKFNNAQALSMGKVIEMRGGFKSEADMKAQADFMQKVMAGTGGRVMPSDYLAFLKTSGVAGRLQDTKAFYLQMEPLIQEMGGSRVGTALMSAYNNLGQGRTTVRTARELMRLGLVDPKMVEFNKLGQLNRIKPGGVAGGDLVAADPLRFLREILLPAFAKKGISGEKSILNEIATIFTNRTAASLFSLIYLQAAKIDKNMAVTSKAKGVNALIAQGQNTPMGLQLRAEKAWENFRIQLGLKVLPIVLPLIEKLANGLQYLASAAEKHPTLTKWFALSFLGLSALLVVIGGIAAVAGSIMLLGAAVGGGIAASTALVITGIAAGLTLLGAAIVAWWPQISNFFKMIGNLAGKAWKWAWTDPLENLRKTMRQAAGITPDGKHDARMAGAPPRPPAVPTKAATAAGGVQVSKNDLANAVKTALNGTSVQMDGKQVGRIVTAHQGDAATAPATGPSRQDTRMSPLQPAHAF